ncbi:hypothetical protein ABTA37_19875, partial [Acinetobacter baumannii]
SLTFSGTAGQRISLQSSNVSECFTWSIVNPDSSYLQAPVGWCGNYYAGPYTLPVTGTYKLYIVPSNGAIGSVTWQIYNVPADTTGTITIG